MTCLRKQRNVSILLRELVTRLLTHLSAADLRFAARAVSIGSSSFLPMCRPDLAPSSQSI
jgi:hypothetical protein